MATRRVLARTYSRNKFGGQGGLRKRGNRMRNGGHFGAKPRHKSPFHPVPLHGTIKRY
jgi:hypothetical protein